MVIEQDGSDLPVPVSRCSKSRAENTASKDPNLEYDENNLDFLVPHPIVNENAETFLHEPTYNPWETTAAKVPYHASRNELKPNSSQLPPPSEATDAN